MPSLCVCVNDIAVSVSLMRRLDPVCWLAADIITVAELASICFQFERSAVDL